MRLSTTAALTTLVAIVAAAPVPSPADEENLVEAHEEGLLLLVPTLPADNTGEKNGADLKREVDDSVLPIAHPVTHMCILFFIAYLVLSYYAVISIHSKTSCILHSQYTLINELISVDRNVHSSTRPSAVTSKTVII